MPTLCGSLDSFATKGLILKDTTWCNDYTFECRISQARYNNTPSRFSPSFIFYTDIFCHYNDSDVIDFQCLPYASLKIMCDCVDIDNEISNVSYSEWCGCFVFFLSFFFLV